jgi:putative transposase
MKSGALHQAECMLVVIGATPEGKKELVGFQVGTRESAQSWRELLVGLKARGLAIAPELAVGDGALGFWKALEEVFPAARHQRCPPGPTGPGRFAVGSQGDGCTRQPTC